MSGPDTSPAILLIEGDVELRDYVRRCLSRLPLPSRILEANDLPRALEQIRDGDVDLVIGVLDGTGHSGPQLCDALGVGREGQTPVLLLATGVSSAMEIRNVRSLRTTRVLPGTPTTASLCSTVHTMLEEHGN